MKKESKRPLHKNIEYVLTDRCILEYAIRKMFTERLKKVKPVKTELLYC